MPELSIKINEFLIGRTTLIFYLKKKEDQKDEMSGVYDLWVATSITPLIFYRKSNQCNKFKYISNSNFVGKGKCKKPGHVLSSA